MGSVCQKITHNCDVIGDKRSSKIIALISNLSWKKSPNLHKITYVQCINLKYHKCHSNIGRKDVVAYVFASDN